MPQQLLCSPPPFPAALKQFSSPPLPMLPTPYSNSNSLTHGFNAMFPPWRRQTQEHKADMDAMQTKLAQYERFLGLMINVGLHQRVLGDAHAAMRAGVDTDEALVDAIKEAAAIPGNAWSTIISSVTGPRTQDEYKSSLNLTIKTRKELRDVRKIAKFWKNVAQDEGRLDIVTPSVSTISSIHETLPPERQKAVEELMVTRRRLSPESQSKAIELAVAGLPNSASSSSSSLTSTSLASTSADITPSNSAIELHCLSPLASESFKSELASRSSSTRLFKRSLSSKPIRPPLGTIDTNIGLNLSDQRAEARGKRKADSTDENALPHVYTAPVRGRDLVVSSVVPSFSKHSICTNRLGPLGRIEEEREDFLCIDAEDVQVGTELQMQKGQVSRGMAVSQESNWCMVEFPEQDLSFSFCDTTMSSPPKIGQANAATPTKSSRLPKPVLRKLNRMTIPKSTAGHGIDLEVLRAPTPLFIKKRSTDGLATTRLPTSTQGRRLWRT
ncbi:hypothetical protein R3P38DRAFT_3396274 [Favolaschia claudopus]|uniref:Uncharacterized protein n=1 Tax=Favolaschia claudopus TaxID=2862362 RepID=A0AAW0BCN3_9AGAR